MSVCIELPSELEANLRAQIADLDSAAKGVFLVALYRRESITHYELATALGLDRMGVENLLKRHGVVEDLPTTAELQQQVLELESRSKLMIVVSDTSPLHYLILIHLDHLLPQLFGRVLVPRAVINELNHINAPDTVRNWITTPPVWLEIQNPKNLSQTTRLGPGETAAIDLACEMPW